MHGLLVGQETDDHKCRSYKIGSDKDGTYNNQGEEICEDHPNICKSLPEEEDILKQKTTNIQDLNELKGCFGILNQQKHLNNN